MDSYVCYCYFIFYINQGMPAVQKRLPAICKMEIFLRMKKKTLKPFVVFPKVVLRKASK